MHPVTEKNKSILKQFARNGANFLDTNHPTWVKDIHAHIERTREPLYLNNKYHCPLGKLYGVYDKAVAQLNLDTYTQKLYGFIMDFSLLDLFENDIRDGYISTEKHYQALTECWLEEMALRTANEKN